jgi:hypothetical protein
VPCFSLFFFRAWFLEQGTALQRCNLPVVQMMTMTLLNASSSGAVGCSIVAPSLHCTQVLLSPPPLLCRDHKAHIIPSPSRIFPCIASLRIGRSVRVSTQLSVGASWTSNRHRLRR